MLCKTSPSTRRNYLTMLLLQRDVLGGVPREQKHLLLVGATAPETAAEEQRSKGFSKEVSLQWKIQFHSNGNLLERCWFLRETLIFFPWNSFIKISTWKLIFHEASMQNWTVSESELAYERSHQKGVTFQRKPISFSLFWGFFFQFILRTLYFFCLCPLLLLWL